MERLAQQRIQASLFAKKLVCSVQNRLRTKMMRMKEKAHVPAQLQAKFVLVRLRSRKPMVTIHLLDASVEEVHPPAVVEAHNAHGARFDHQGYSGRDDPKGHVSPSR